MSRLRQARLGRDPVRPANPADQLIVVLLAVLADLAWITIKGIGRICGANRSRRPITRSIGIMYIILALVMLVRGFIDAIMMRAQQAIAVGQSQGYLPPEHYDQIFSAHGTIMIFFMAMPLRHRSDELRRAAATRRSRRRLSDDEQRQLLADRVGRTARQPQPLHRRVRAHRLARLSAVEREGFLARRRGRLLSRRAANLRGRNGAHRSQFRHDDPQNSRARDELSAHAGLLLDLACSRTC